MNTEEEINEPLISQMKTKNKWLYPTDEFGKMEEGVVYDAQNNQIIGVESFKTGKDLEKYLPSIETKY
jgi:hypothetical protein